LIEKYIYIYIYRERERERERERAGGEVDRGREKGREGKRENQRLREGRRWREDIDSEWGRERRRYMEGGRWGQRVREIVGVEGARKRGGDRQNYFMLTGTCTFLFLIMRVHFTNACMFLNHMHIIFISIFLEMPMRLRTRVSQERTNVPENVPTWFIEWRFGVW
jgi:hypothetical protein